MCILIVAVDLFKHIFLPYESQNYFRFVVTNRQRNETQSRSLNNALKSEKKKASSSSNAIKYLSCVYTFTVHIYYVCVCILYIYILCIWNAEAHVLNEVHKRNWSCFRFTFYLTMKVSSFPVYIVHISILHNHLHISIIWFHLHGPIPDADHCTACSPIAHVRADLSDNKIPTVYFAIIVLFRSHAIIHIKLSSRAIWSRKVTKMFYCELLKWNPWQFQINDVAYKWADNT